MFADVQRSKALSDIVNPGGGGVRPATTAYDTVVADV